MDLVQVPNAYTEMPLTRRLVYLRDAVLVLVGRDMKLRYKRSVLGILWTMLNPLAQLLVLGFVFRTVVPSSIPNYTSFLFTGLLVWNWFVCSLISACSSVVDNRDLIKCPEFRPGILPVVYVTTYLVHFLLALPILLLILQFEHVPLRPVAFFLPVVIILQFLFTLGLGYLVATFHVPFRDTQYLLSVVLSLAFFVTPIFYDMSTVPAAYLPWYRINPMAHVVAAYRDVLLKGKMPDLLLLLWLYLAALLLLGLGYWVFRRASVRFVEAI
jgi:lipopolysaccharide transport system permease protein